MATKIILKKSSVAGNAPATTQLDQSELAINLVDRKIYTKNNSNQIIRLDGAYVSSTAPSGVSEGDLWYDTANNALMAHDGTTWQSAGYQTFAELEDTNITNIAAGEILKWDGNNFVNNTLAEADIQAASNTTQDARDSISAGTGVTYTAATGVVAIGQAVETTSDVTFNDATLTGELKGPGNFTIDPSGHGDNTGTVVIAGNLTVNGVTTSVNSNEVNIGDSIIVLNSDEVGAPSQNGGFEIERGTETNVSFVWDESNDYWSLGNEELAEVTLDGGSY